MAVLAANVARFIALQSAIKLGMVALLELNFNAGFMV